MPEKSFKIGQRNNRNQVNQDNRYANNIKILQAMLCMHDNSDQFNIKRQHTSAQFEVITFHQYKDKANSISYGVFS